MKLRLLLAWVVILVTLHVLNIYTTWNGLQLEIEWLDMPFHFFGGVGVGVFGLWLAVATGFLPTKESNTYLAERMRAAFEDGAPWWWSFGSALVVAGVIMLGWEQFEVFLVEFVDFPIAPEGYTFDTMVDYVLGSLGAGCAWLVYYRVQYGVWQEAKATATPLRQKSHSTEALVK